MVSHLEEDGHAAVIGRNIREDKGRSQPARAWTNLSRALYDFTVIYHTLCIMFAFIIVVTTTLFLYFSLQDNEI